MIISSCKNRACHTVTVALFIILMVQTGKPLSGWCTASVGTVTIQRGNGNINVDDGNVVIYNAPTNKQYAAFRKIILQQEWEAIKDNPAFRKLVRACNNGKDVEQLDKYSKAIFWEDLLKYLDKMEVADANYQQVKQGTVSEELKALYPKIDQARNDFNYAEVNRLLQAFEEEHSGLVQDVAKFYYLKAQNYELQVNYPEAERYYRKAATIEDQDTVYLDAHARILQRTGNYAAAEPLFRRVLAIYEKQLGSDHLSVATGMYNLAGLMGAQGKYAAAETLSRRALAIYEKQLGSDHPFVATGLNGLASFLRDQGKYAEAEPLFRRELAIFEKTLGPDHSDVATSLYNLASLERDQGNYAAAEPLFRRSLAIHEKTLGPDHPYVAVGLDGLALLLRDQGKYTAAEPLFRRSLAIHEKILGPEHPDVATSLSHLASLLKRQGNYAAAEPLFRRALVIDEKALGLDHPTTITIRNNFNSLLKP
ncbi:MAG: tetratricopeptide repeat protein [Pelodictyon phaeoclathratiforme]